MAHSRGDVFNHESSYIAAVCSPKRRVALELIDEFVEDFKAQAPIWKYDIIDNKRIYAQDRSTAIKGSGLLLWKNTRYWLSMIVYLFVIHLKVWLKVILI